MYFKKIDLKLRDFEYNDLKGRVLFSFGKIDTNISYHAIKDKNLLKLLYDNDICKISPDHCYLAEVTGIGLLRPHRDHDTTCCLNYYFQSNNSKTVFYKPKENTKSYQYENKKTSNIYNLRDLDTTEKFTAKDNEAFLLNVSEVHSVFCANSGFRRFITWQWTNTNFEDVLENLNYSIVD
jgi:hypothetical protein